MFFEFFLAWRFLRAPNRLARFTAAAAIAGIAGGVAAMIVAQALANGFRREMQDKILQNTAHVSVFRRDNTEISDWQNLSEKIKQIEGVTNVSATTFDSALLIGETSSSYAVLRGVQSPKSKVQSPIENQNIKVEIGKVLAERTGLRAGDAAQIVLGQEVLGGNFAPTSTTVEVGAVFETGFYEYDSTWIRLSLADAARLAEKSFPSATALNIETADIYWANETAARISDVLGADFNVLDWQQANRPLFSALTLERRVALTIILLIVFIAALNITTTLALIVNERRADIAVLKTCGAKAKNIVSIFLIEGAILGLTGIFLGVILGFATCSLCNHYDLISLPSDVYSISSVKLEPDSTSVIITISAAFILSLLATVLPTQAAARVRPLDNLKS